MIKNFQFKKVGLVLTLTFILLLSTVLVSAAIKDNAARVGYHEFLYLGIMNTIDNTDNYINVANHLILNSGNNLILASSPGSGSVPGSYIYQGAPNSTSRAHAVAINDPLWVTRNAYVDELVRAQGFRINQDDDPEASKAAIGWVDSYDGGDPALLIKSGFSYAPDSSIAFQPGKDWPSRMVLDKDGNLNVRGDVIAENVDVTGDVSADTLCLGADCISDFSSLGTGSGSVWSTSGNDIYYDAGDVLMNNMVLFDGGISSYKLTEQDIIDGSAHVVDGTFRSGPPSASKPYTSFDFDEDLIPGFIPEGNNLENYYLRVTSGLDTGNFVKITGAWDNAGWDSSTDLFFVSPGVQLFAGDTFEVLFNDEVVGAVGDPANPINLNGAVNIQNELTVGDDIVGQGDLTIDGNIGGVKNIVGPGLNLAHTIPKVASDNLRNAHDSETSSTSSTRVVVKRITFPNGLIGQIKVKFDMKFVSSSPEPSCEGVAVLYKGSTELKDLRKNPGNAYETAERILIGTFNPGESLDIKTGMSSTCSNNGRVYVRNFRIYYDDDSTAVASQNSNS